MPIDKGRIVDSNFQVDFKKFLKNIIFSFYFLSLHTNTQKYIEDILTFQRSLMSRVNCVMGPFLKLFMFLEIDYCLDVSQSSVVSRPDRCDWNLSQTRKCNSWALAIIKYWRHYLGTLTDIFSLSNSLNITL